MNHLLVWELAKEQTSQIQRRELIYQDQEIIKTVMKDHLLRKVLLNMALVQAIEMMS